MRTKQQTQVRPRIRAAVRVATLFGSDAVPVLVSVVANAKGAYVRECAANALGEFGRASMVLSSECSLMR